MEDHVRGVALLAALVGAAACGADGQASSAEPAARSTGAEAADATDAAETDATGDGEGDASLPPGEGLVYGADPRLTMYVNGPWPVGAKTGESSPTGTYEAEIVVVNTGEEAARIEEANIWFTGFRGGDEQISCSPPLDGEPVAGPARLEPGDAHTYEVQVRCDLSEPGQYSIDAYMKLGAVDPDGDLDLERHHVGQYELTVP